MMHKRSSKSKQGPEDLNEQAFRVLSEAVGDVAPVEQHEKNPAAVAMGRLGGKKGGTARAASLTQEQRTAIAKKAAQTRWQKEKDA